ncbi:DDB1- and CUL4-associated factor 1-like isoform X2 [Artemia franciscana]|uniref:DDB1- and CUL4-associated factor 1 n=1 Tax=Artemia franciscana TaxID=6661 RepID=A0AA88IEP1_ARTSF|nr:hypothetical protein QYM36_001683 [Artemia franciscana]
MEGSSFDLATATDISTILRQWEENHQVYSFDPVPWLNRLADLVEGETELYMKMDPDPFDDRHPSRSDPTGNLGHMLKTIFKRDTFVNKLIGEYSRENYWSRLGQPDRDVNTLNVAATRLLLDVVPGLEASIVFQEAEGLITKLFSWAEKAPNPLQTYATGLLATAMEVSEIAGNHKDKNMHLVPIMLERLRDILNVFLEEKKKEKITSVRPFAMFQSKSQLKDGTINVESSENRLDDEPDEDPPTDAPSSVEIFAPPKKKIRRRKSRRDDEIKASASTQIKLDIPTVKEESSNSSWAELEVNLIGTIQIHPLTDSTKMIMIFRYLASLGEYQDLLGHCIEHNAIDLILRSIDLKITGDSRLAFEALKYLSTLLCHKRFVQDFLCSDGLRKLLVIPRPSIAATGVSLCLYFLACSEDAMERICSGDQRVVEHMVIFAMWLLECGHESGRWNATLFFAVTFKLAVILDLFDKNDGLRLLYNAIATLSIFNDDEGPLDEDKEYVEKQSVKHVCSSLKRYFEAHMIRKLQLLAENVGSPTNSYQNMVKDNMYDNIQLLLEFLPFRAKWPAIDRFLSLNGIHQMLKIIAMAYDWTFNGRSETVRSALEVLALVSVYPRAQLALCEKVDVPFENSAVGIHIVLGASEGEIVNDSEVQKAALNAIINCVCAPKYRIGDDVSNMQWGTKKKSRSPEDLLEKMWECVRANNGIMVLLQLLLTKAPITDADSIRALACQALCGLARSAKVTQIMSQLPLFTSGQLQVLIREPILQDKRQEHVKFQKFAIELLERVLGKSKPALNEFDYSLDRIRRADIVAQTRISFNEKQLLMLIQQHLLSRGFGIAADALQKEADLPYQQPRILARSTVVGTPGAARARTFPVNHGASLPNRTVSNCQSTPSNGPSNSPRPTVKRIKTPRALQKAVENQLAPVLKVAPDRPNNEAKPSASLDDIVKEYLMNQHSLCRNPMVTCPEFDLFVPHKCPDPKPRGSAPTNFTMRYQRRALYPPAGGPMGAMLDRHLVYSRYKPSRTIKQGDSDSAFTCATFSACEQFVMVGTQTGDLKLFNKMTGADEATYTCHDSAIFKIEPNRDGSLVLTSSSWRRPLSALWSMGEFFDLKYSFDDEESLEFSKMTQDKVVGTRNEVATIYDVNTGQSLMSLKPTSSNAYTRNQATFNDTDDLILSDGVLWDVTSGKVIHKFDKLNQQLSGVFHPNGLEIVSSAEVWDLRTFHLLRTVPTLAQCVPSFSHSSKIMFGIPLDKEPDDEGMHSDSSFRVLDAQTYSQIATIDIKKSIYSLSIDTDDLTLVLVENTARDDVYGDLSESIVRLYDIGRQKDEDQQAEQEEEEETDEDDDEDGGSHTFSEAMSFLEDIQSLQSDSNSDNGPLSLPSVPSSSVSSYSSNSDSVDSYRFLLDYRR